MLIVVNMLIKAVKINPSCNKITIYCQRPLYEAECGNVSLVASFNHKITHA